MNRIFAMISMVLVVVFAHGCGNQRLLDSSAKPEPGGNVTQLALSPIEPTNPGTGTPGYWKNHPQAWPVESIFIGATEYTKAEAIALMGAPEKGNKALTIFRALVAAKLNVLIDNDDSCIDGVIYDADVWLIANLPPTEDVRSGNIRAGGRNSPWRQGEPLYIQLDAYNNGLLCAPSRDSLE